MANTIHVDVVSAGIRLSGEARLVALPGEAGELRLSAPYPAEDRTARSVRIEMADGGGKSSSRFAGGILRFSQTV